MKWTISIFLASLSCIVIMGMGISNENSIHPFKAEKLVEKILVMSSKEIQNNFPLSISGKGASMPSDNIKQLSLALILKGY